MTAPRHQTRLRLRRGPCGRHTGKTTRPARTRPRSQRPARRPRAARPARARRSTHQLLTPGRFLLLAGEDGTGWLSAAARAQAERGAFTVGTDLVCDRDRHTLYGINSAGAILVRPDGHITMRAAGASHDRLARTDRRSRRSEPPHKRGAVSGGPPVTRINMLRRQA
ncbi:hypothetical protein ACH41H_49775 [Streptomyces sp. NPDC020800]|uniref:aromatic-ring hydroxylase C-terminal domain-containing protein n=1 Tax=Streptomyces sp. NPDC020800 TaxID=3365092 RepID=UPI0037A852ED